MPHQDRLEFKVLGLAPKDDEVAWQYMDFVSLVALLETRSLFFRLPAHFADPWEACFPRNRGLVDLAKQYSGFAGLLQVLGGSIAEDMLRFGLGVNCWHLSGVESEAMWKIYGKDGFGVSVHLPIRELKECFREVKAPVVFSRVAYIEDYANPDEQFSYLPPFLLKRASFRHESEMRAIVGLQELEEAGDITEPPLGSDPQGVLVKIVPEILLRRVILSPFAQSWYVELVQRLLKRFGIHDCNVVKSSLMDECPWRSDKELRKEDGNIVVSSPISADLVDGALKELKDTFTQFVNSGRVTINMNQSMSTEEANVYPAESPSVGEAAPKETPEK